ncbi:hypothetical protein CDAR_419421 [Caerostris darwini]|uniref:Uncharacterized protein n=1 Tax=Caerostris darwini TaxID=1538125 RepID=A0AAV4PWE5_9ARAC|nr:hypothetical protein CDAR_419421 [Caerostris darwini]
MNPFYLKSPSKGPHKHVRHFLLSGQGGNHQKRCLSMFRSGSDSIPVFICHVPLSPKPDTSRILRARNKAAISEFNHSRHHNRTQP